MYHLLVSILVGLQILHVSNAQACLSCGPLPKTVSPPATGTADGAGGVVESIDAETGCKRYDITCNANGNKFVVIGANEVAIQLSEASSGQKTAVLLCNHSGQIEGCDQNDNSVIVTSFYCAYAT